MALSKSLQNAVRFTSTLGETRRELDQAAKQVSRDGGGDNAVLALRAGEKEAGKYLTRLAGEAAQVAQSAYAELGLSLAVEGRRVGRNLNLTVKGGEKDQKLARIVEGGARAIDPFDFIRLAKKKRPVKLLKSEARKDGTFAPRKSGESGGFYLIVPIRHGRVKRGEDGKLTLDPSSRNRARGGADLTLKDLKALYQFEARPTGEVESMAPLEGSPDFYREGRDEGAGWKVVATREQGVGREYTPGPGAKEQHGEYRWERPVMSQAIRSVGYMEGKKYVRDSPGKRSSEQYSSREGLRLTKRLGANGKLTFTAPEADLPDEPADSPARVAVQKRAGDVVSFRTLSTRSGNLKPIGGMKPHRVLSRASEWYREAVRARMGEAQGSGTADSPFLQGYLKTLQAALSG